MAMACSNRIVAAAKPKPTGLACFVRDGGKSGLAENQDFSDVFCSGCTVHSA